jgi:hypothetical protein
VKPALPGDAVKPALPGDAVKPALPGRPRRSRYRAGAQTGGAERGEQARVTPARSTAPVPAAEVLLVMCDPFG